MKPKTEGLEWFNQLLEQHPQTSQMVADELPNRKQEAWRYAGLNRLYRQVFSFPESEISAAARPGFDDWIYPKQDSYRLLFVNGRFDREHSQLPAVDGCLLKPLSELDQADRNLYRHHTRSRTEFNHDAFDQLNEAIHRDGFVLHVQAGHVLDRPVEVVYLNHASEQQILSPTRSLVLLDRGSGARVIEHFVGEEGAGCFCSNTTWINLGEEAELSHSRFQNQAKQAYHLDRVFLEQKRNSRFAGWLLATGAGWSRSETLANLNGPGAECHLNGLYGLAENQYNDVHLDIRHLQPHCTSSENFRGILSGKGRAVFDGRILVDKDAQKTSAQLSNKNLLLAEGAEIDTKPQLEIYADDVSCSHGTTVGKIDPDQVFYCVSRGIAEQKALEMLSLGFAAEVLERIDDPILLAAAHAQFSSALEAGEQGGE